MIVTLFADGLQVELVEFGLFGHFGVTDRTGEVVDAPGLVQSRKHVARDHRVAHETHVPE